MKSDESNIVVCLAYASSLCGLSCGCDHPLPTYLDDRRGDGGAALSSSPDDTKSIVLAISFTADELFRLRFDIDASC